MCFEPNINLLSVQGPPCSQRSWYQKAQPFHVGFKVPIPSWFDDPNDRELLNLLPFMEDLSEAEDVYSPLKSKGFTSQAKQTTACIQLQLQQQMQQLPVHLQQSTDDDKDER